jgi:integrase/recombinase XerD
MQVSELVRKVSLRRGLSPRTIKTYQNCLNKFFRVVKKDPNYLKKSDIQDYLDGLLERKAPGNTINVYLNALKFFYEQVLNKKLTLNLRFSKKRKTLPTFLTQEETSNFFKVIKNKKHKLMVTLMYSAGLRVSELVHLKVEDFNFENNYGWVREGKGKKDRLFIIAKKLKEEIIEHIDKNALKHDSWLFPGFKNKHYSVSSIQNIVKKTAKKASINRNIHPHTLRHSFATHLIQNGYSVLELQPLLGHRNIETTLIYTHMASPNLIKIKSPFDQLENR